jgi:hypothetical protein
VRDRRISGRFGGALRSRSAVRRRRPLLFCARVASSCGFATRGSAGSASMGALYAFAGEPGDPLISHPISENFMERTILVIGATGAMGRPPAPMLRYRDRAPGRLTGTPDGVASRRASVDLPDPELPMIATRIGSLDELGQGSGAQLWKRPRRRLHELDDRGARDRRLRRTEVAQGPRALPQAALRAPRREPSQILSSPISRLPSPAPRLPSPILVRVRALIPAPECVSRPVLPTTR